VESDYRDILDLIYIYNLFASVISFAIALVFGLVALYSIGGLLHQFSCFLISYEQQWGTGVVILGEDSYVKNHLFLPGVGHHTEDTLHGVGGHRG
jgi:hypothetical protein